MQRTANPRTLVQVQVMSLMKQHPDYMPCPISHDDMLKALEAMWKTNPPHLNKAAGRPLIVARMLPMIDGLVIQ